MWCLPFGTECWVLPSPAVLCASGRLLLPSSLWLGLHTLRMEEKWVLFSRGGRRRAGLGGGDGPGEEVVAQWDRSPKGTEFWVGGWAHPPEVGHPYSGFIQLCGSG